MPLTIENIIIIGGALVPCVFAAVAAHRIYREGSKGLAVWIAGVALTFGILTIWLITTM